MNRRMPVVILFVLAVGAASLTSGMRGLAQPAPHRPPAAPVRQPMPMPAPAAGPQMGQMMPAMEATVKKLRTQINRVNPHLLTGQQRPIYEYLKLLQTHLETTSSMMRAMQGPMHDAMMRSMMRQMMGPQMPMHQPMTEDQHRQMRQQMQGQMAQMQGTVKALRAQLNKVNPDLLTGQERLIHEYLKMLQTHLETVASMMQTMPDSGR